MTATTTTSTPAEATHPPPLTTSAFSRDCNVLDGLNSRTRLIAASTLVALAALAVWDQQQDRTSIIRLAGTTTKAMPKKPPTTTTTPPPPPRTLFVFLAGLEGTGHHLYETLYREASTKLADIFHDGEIALRDDITALQSSLYNDRAPEKGLFTGHLAVLKGRPNHVNGTMVFDSIVRQLEAINAKVLYWLDKHHPQSTTLDDGDHRTIDDRNNDIPDNPWRVPARYDVTSTPFPIPINGLAERGSGMMSYPNFLRPSRPLQYPDLHLLYRACHAARVHCGHVYLHRDPRGIIESTVVKRRYGTEDDQIALYTTMAAVLRAQLLDHGEQVIACLDYDHLLSETTTTFQPSPNQNDHDNNSTVATSNNSADLDRFLHLFGIVPEAFRQNFRPPKASNFTVSPYLQIYMDTLVATNRATWDTCTNARREQQRARHHDNGSSAGWFDR